MSLKISAFIVFAILFVSCGNHEQNTNVKDTAYKLPAVDTGGAIVGDWIIQREMADPQRLNPVTVQDAIGQELSYYVFERMLWAADRTTYETFPWIAAEQPTLSDDHLVYTFKLKKNIKFSNEK